MDGLPPFTKARHYKSMEQMVLDGWFSPQGLVTREDVHRHISRLGFSPRNVWVTESPMHGLLYLHLRPHRCSQWRRRFRKLERSMRRQLPFQVGLVTKIHNHKEP